jgi:hypothetical protein
MADVQKRTVGQRGPDKKKRKPGSGMHDNHSLPPVPESYEVTEENLTLIQAEAAAGTTRLGIARKLGISNSVLDTWMKTKPSVREAWERGMSMDEFVYTSRLRNSVLDPRDKFGGPAAMFFLKCKHKWRERQTVEVEMSDEARSNAGSLFSPAIEIVETHRDPNTGQTTQEPTVTEVAKGQ